MSRGALATARVRLKVPFHDLDPMGVVWHGNYVKYFEIARDALFERHGFDIYEYCNKSGYILPIIRMNTKHVHPLRYGEAFVCEARLMGAHSKITVDYEVWLEGDDVLVARGRTEQVAVSVEEQKLEMRVPAEIRQAFGL